MGLETDNERRREDRLTDIEVLELRAMLDADKKLKWLGRVIRNIAVWIVAVIGGMSLAYSSLIDVIKHLASK